MRFVKIFRGDAYIVERSINEILREGNLKIISASTAVYQGTLYVTVVFEEKEE